MLPSHYHLRGKDLRITNPTEIDFAENNLVHGILPRWPKTLTADNPIKNRSKIAKYSQFFGPTGIIRSIGRIVRLVNTQFDTKHPIILEASNTIFRLFARSLSHKYFHNGLEIIRFVFKTKNALLGLRRLIRSNKSQSVARCKRKASTIHQI